MMFTTRPTPRESKLTFFFFLFSFHLEFFIREAELLDVVDLSRLTLMKHRATTGRPTLCRMQTIRAETLDVTGLQRLTSRKHCVMLCDVV